MSSLPQLVPEQSTCYSAHISWLCERSPSYVWTLVHLHMAECPGMEGLRIHSLFRPRFWLTYWGSAPSHAPSLGIRKLTSESSPQPLIKQSPHSTESVRHTLRSQRVMVAGKRPSKPHQSSVLGVLESSAVPVWLSWRNKMRRPVRNPIRIPG